MNRKIVSLVFVSLLILSTVIVAAALVTTPATAEGRSAWLKIVTSAWKGISCGDNDVNELWTSGAYPHRIYDGVKTGFKGDQLDETTPMCPDPKFSGFADRFNVTGIEAFVEVYGIKPEMGYTPLQGTFEPNATGFVKISWSVDDNWGLLVLVKAKSYYGEKIGAGTPFKGIIIYALVIPPRSMTLEAKEKFINLTRGINLDGPGNKHVYFSDGTSLNMLANPVGNWTVNDDGLLDNHKGYFDFNLPRAGIGSGPFDILNGTSVSLASFAKIFGNETKAGTPVNAWIARAAKMFKIFHVHSWYNIKDNLSFAQIKIYDLDHTDPASEASLIQAAVTGEDGQSRYTREIYPSKALEYRKFWDNHLVPIPLQIFNLKNNTIYHGGIYAPETDEGPIGAPKLNATVRVWWETVIVNQTIYYGWEYNGTGTWTLLDPLGKRRPDFVGPLSMALNHTVTTSGRSPDGIWVDKPFDENYTNVANILNATVFYARFCVQDADLQIQHPEIGDKLVNMPIGINLKTEEDRPYYLTKNLPTTDNGGCSDDPHKYRGWMSQFSKFSRFPNGTVWYALYVDGVYAEKNNIPDYFDVRGTVSFWKSFGQHVRLNTSLAYLPGDARNYNDIPEGPNLKDVKTPSLIGDEDVKKSDYYNGNWSMLVANVPYANTLTLRDDKSYKGFDVVFKWSGGARNNYPGQEKVVDVLRVENPYAIALLYDYVNERIFGQWIFPNIELANNKLMIKIHEAKKIRLYDLDEAGKLSEIVLENVEDKTLEIMGATGIYLSDYNPDTGTFDVVITGTFDVVINGNGLLAVNVIEDKSDPEVDYGSVAWIEIDDALCTIKKHDVAYFSIELSGGQGQVDVKADGSDEYTTVDRVDVYGGPIEVEIWPGAPGTGTIRALVTPYDADVEIWINNLAGPTFTDYSEVLLIKGPPRLVSMLVLEGEGGSLSGEFQVDIPSIPTPGKLYGGSVTGGSLTARILPTGMTGSLSFSFSTTADIGVLNDVLFEGDVDLDVSGGFSDPNDGTFHGTVSGRMDAWLDHNNDGSMQPDELVDNAKVQGSIFCEDIYPGDKISASCSLSLLFNGLLAGETFSGILIVDAPFNPELDDEGTITSDFTADTGEVSGAFAWKAEQAVPGKFGDIMLDTAATNKIVGTFYPEGMQGDIDFNIETAADIAGPIEWSYTITTNIPIENVLVLTYNTFNMYIDVPISGLAIVDFDNDGSADDRIDVSGTIRLLLTNPHLHWALRETTPGSFSVDPGNSFITVTVDINNDGTPECSGTATGTDLTIGASQDIQTYHDLDTGVVTILSTGAVTISTTKSIGDCDGDGTADEFTSSLSASFSLSGTVALSTITFTGGAASVIGTTSVISSGNGADPNIPTSGSVLGSSLPSTGLTIAGTDRYRVSGSVSCSFSGIIPIVGTVPGSVSCSGSVSLSIDFHYNDGSVEISDVTATLASASGQTSTSHNGAGVVTITITTPPTLTGSSTSTKDLDLDDQLDDVFTVSKTVTTIAPITGTLNPAGPTLTITAGTIQASGTDVVDINGANDPPNDIAILETDTSSTFTVTSITTLSTVFDNIRFIIDGTDLAVTGTVIDPTTGTYEATIQGTLSGGIDLSMNGQIEQNEKFTVFATGTLTCTGAWPTTNTLECDIALTFGGNFNPTISPNDALAGTINIANVRGSATLDDKTGDITWTFSDTSDTDNNIAGEFELENEFLDQVWHGVIDPTGNIDRLTDGAASLKLVGPIHFSGKMYATWKGDNAEIGNVGGLDIRIELNGIDIQGLIPDVSVGDLEAIFDGGSAKVRIFIEDPDTGHLVEVDDENVQGILFCPNAWEQSFPRWEEYCSVTFTFSGFWQGKVLAGVASDASPDLGALDDPFYSITDTTVPEITIDDFDAEQSFLRGLFILNEEAAVSGTIDSASLTSFGLELDMTDQVKLAGDIVGLTISGATVEIGTVKYSPVTLILAISDLNGVVVDVETGDLTANFKVVIPFLSATGSGSMSCSAPSPSGINFFGENLLCSLTIDFDGTLDGSPISGTIIIEDTWVSPVNLLSNGMIEETLSEGSVSGDFTANVAAVVPGLIHHGYLGYVYMEFEDTGAETVSIHMGADLAALVDIGNDKNIGSYGYLEAWGHGTIDNDNNVEAVLSGILNMYVPGWGWMSTSLRGVIDCYYYGAGYVCHLAADFDGYLGDLPVSGSLIIEVLYVNSLYEIREFLTLWEEEWLEAKASPTNMNLEIDGVPVASVDYLDLYSGIKSVHVAPSMIMYAGFDYGHYMYTEILLDDTVLTATLYNASLMVSTPSGWTWMYDLTGDLKLRDMMAGDYYEFYSFVVPLKDDPMDDEYDKWIFGGYDDFALTGTGHVYVTAWVHDIVYYVTDNLGDPLPAGQTEVDLILPNGEVVKRTPAPPELADIMPGSLQWSYKHYGEGNAVFFQLPGATGPYGARVLYAGTEVYSEKDTIDILETTEFVTIVVKVFKVKLVFEDCQGQLMPGLYYKFTLPNGRTDWDRTSREGEADFPYMSGGTLTIHAVWWKGVEIPLMEAKFATGEKIQLVDGKLVLEIGEGINAPIVVKVPIKDIIFYTMDFQGEIKIPRLNITVTWLGTPKPWSTTKIYYLETLDPTGDANTELYNTSIQVHPLWFNYTVKAFFQKIADDSPMDGMTEWEAKYVFYKMPPTIYNITVTTVTDEATYGPEPVNGKGGVTPGTSKWPGRKDVEVPYEIKIDWKGWSEKYEDTVPKIRTKPADKVNDRVVLRIFGSMNGVPVTTDNFPAWLVEAWNPELIGIRTCEAVGCVCKEEVKLKTWAHDFWKSVIDGEYRVGDAKFKIMNDNKQYMIYYDLDKKMWTGEDHTSKWTEDIKDLSGIMKDSHYTSNIYWNGSYLLTDLRFKTNMTYSYEGDHKGTNASFIVDKFYNKTAKPNEVAPTLNFTLVGTENLWKTDRRFAAWVKRIEGLTWKDWYKAWFLVYELPKDTDEYKVAKGQDGKGILPIPLPVAFVKLGAFAKGGEPLNKALIELWTLHLDVKNKLKISAADKGSGTILWNGQEIEVEWLWEKKRVETAEPQVYDWKRWDRVWLTFRAYEMVSEECEFNIEVYGVNLTNSLRDTRLAVCVKDNQVLEVWLHYVGHVPEESVTYTVELKLNGDLIAANTTTFPLTERVEIVIDGLKVEIDPYEWSEEEGVWVDSGVFVSGKYVIRLPTPEVSEEATIFVQVPPSPAKLILRNVLPKTGLDVAVSADYVYPLITKEPRDMNRVVVDEWGEEDGVLSYGRWYTEADGYVKSFKAFGPTDPRYGSIILPTAGWLNETFHDGSASTKNEFHYQINIVWKSAVVYSDNIVLDKKGYVTGFSEVYTVTFYLALSNSTKAPVKGLNAWIYYPNVTEWWSEGLWFVQAPALGVYPEDIYPPQDYEACEDSIFPCEKRVTLTSEAWADGWKTFELIPGPRFMNTTWKYVFSANHTAIDWMDDLVATQFVLNNETFGDGALRVKTTTRIDVPIMLNAARWVVFEVATWRDEAGVPTAYPMKDYIVKYEIRKPKYLSGPALTAASGQATTDAEGKVVLTSDPSDPRKVFWAGMIIRYRVEPPTYTSNYADKFWSDWLKAKGVDFVDKSADYRAPAVPPIMSHAYYPDEEPTHYAIAEIGTWWVPRSEGGWWCTGLCVHDYRSKPFIVWVDYTAVTVRVTDYNGRPLPGAFVQLWDKASGKLAAWHYTAAKEWEALPLDVAGMIAWHGLDPATDTIKIPFQTKPRMFGGAGFTGVMNVTVGPVAFDTNNDDRIDVNLPCRGVPECSVSGASTSFITYIARAFWLSTDKKPTEATGALVAVWPYMPNVAQKVYDSEEDEITWKLLLPRYVAGAAFRPGMAPYYPQVLYIPTTTAPTGSLVKEHRDVYAAVFDIKMRFSYEGKPLGDIAKDLEVTFEKAYDVLAFKGKDVVDVKFLPRGTYTVIAKYKGVEVARRTLDLSAVNVGTVTADIPLAMRDVSVQVVDMFGRPLVDASITASPNYYAGMSNVGGVITIRAIVTTQTYEFTVSWKSDVYGTEANTIIADTPDGLAARKVIELPVGDVTITVVDREGKPVGGAKVTIGKATLSTDSEGKAVFQQVPLEKGARGITYDVSVERDGVTIKESITFSRSKTTATLIAELFILKVRVVGSAGQGLPFAKVIVKRAGVEIGTYTTDAGGFLEVPNLPLADYSVEAEWKGFKGTATATRDDLTKGRAVEISLPPYMEIAGIPFTLAAFLGLVIGLVILVIVIVILIIEYARWRGRRLGIYPPPPPKK